MTIAKTSNLIKVIETGCSEPKALQRSRECENGRMENSRAGGGRRKLMVKGEIARAREEGCGPGRPRKYQRAELLIVRSG